MYIFISLIFFINNLIGHEKDLEFSKEFIATYDLSKRDTHEYNPYILKKTRKSFLNLEKSLKDSGFSLSGRLCIFGYQEEAVSPYTTDWQRVAIEDEAIVKTHAGISSPTKNIFGFMTGFLLKDAQWMQNNWFKNNISNIMHTFARPIDIFRDSALVFQKHAFGKDYDYIISARDRIERHLYTKDLKKILKELIEFWSNMEERVSKTGSDERIATQDMLFSIDYARALIEAESNIKKFYLGPDITYPIEVLACQKTHATLHAQEFVQKLQSELGPINNENTAYIFCSYVDGVGKSTLLNNIKNWKKYGDNFDAYERCDNSSSQDAQIFELKDKVFIVDLPAQMSHFVIKPDGDVFVDIQTVKEINSQAAQEIYFYVEQKKDLLIEQFRQLKNKLSKENSSLYSTQDSLVQYAHNCNILKVEEKWIGFKYEDKYIIFDKDQPEKLRILVPLAAAHSTGLKNLEPEQMLFSKGLSLPMKYNLFVSDLVKKLNLSGVKNVIFVDFLSMYPRSSRETIRLNFVLQYMQKMFPSDYDLNYSFYKHRINKEQEICHFLNKNFDKATQSLVLESILRWSLDCLLEKIPKDTIQLFSGQELEKQIQHVSNELLNANESLLYKIAQERLEAEKKQYNESYALDRIYQTIVSFNSEPITEFSKVVQILFSKHMAQENLNLLWAGLGAKDIENIDLNSEAQIPFKVSLKDNNLRIFLKMHSECRQENILKEFIRPLRAQWYAILSCLLRSSRNGNNLYELKKQDYFVPSLILHKHSNGFLYAIQKALPVVDISADISGSEIKLPSLVHFNISDLTLNKRSWGLFAQHLYCLDWTNGNTYGGIFGYTYIPNTEKKNLVTRIVDIYHYLYMQAGKPNWYVCITDLFKQLNFDKIVQLLKAELQDKKFETIKSTDSIADGIRLWLRMIATLDMILPDPETRILIRRGSKEDFIYALKMLEKITLPLCYGITFDNPLFEDYSQVNPVISWDIIGI